MLWKSKYCPQRSAVEVRISTAWCSFEACQLINEQREAHNEQREAHSHKIGRLFGDSPNGPWPLSLPSLVLGKYVSGKGWHLCFLRICFWSNIRRINIRADQRSIFMVILYSVLNSNLYVCPAWMYLWQIYNLNQVWYRILKSVRTFGGEVRIFRHPTK